MLSTQALVWKDFVPASCGDRLSPAELAAIEAVSFVSGRIVCFRFGCYRRHQIRGVEIIFAGNANQRKERIAPGIG